MKKKKGFTILEVIISIAIFSIAFTSISTALDAANVIYRNENKKQETITAAQQIMEVLRSKDKLSDFYSNNLKSFYIGFNYDEIDGISETLKTTSAAGATGMTSKIGGDIFKSSTKTTDTDSIAECKSLYNKNLGAWVQITDAKSDISSSNYDLYKVKVTVWNLKEGNGYGSNLSAYISR